MYLGLILITAVTVGKIMLCCVAGIYGTRYFEYPDASVKGLSFVSVRIALPCLLFSNLCLSITWEDLGKFYWAPVLAFVPLILGLACSFAFRLILHERYHALLLLGCTFQNGLTYPISLLINLKGISWIDEEAVATAQSYIFLYNVVCSIGLWAIGEPMIAHAKAKEVAQNQERLAALERTAQEAEIAVLHPTNASFDFPYSPTTHHVSATAAAGNSSSSFNAGKGSRFPSSAGAPGDFPLLIRDSSDSSMSQAARERSNGDDSAAAASCSAAAAAENEEESIATAAAHAHRKASAGEQLSWYKPPKPGDRPLKRRSSRLPDSERNDKSKPDRKRKRDGKRGSQSESTIDSDNIIDANRDDDDDPVDAASTGNGGDTIVVVTYNEEGDGDRSGCSAARIGGIISRSLKSPTVSFSLVAVMISLTPPLRWVAETLVGRVLVSAGALVGTLAIPLQLLVLGCTIASAYEEGTVAVVEADPAATTTTTTPVAKEEESADGGSGGGCRLLDRFAKPSTVFIVCTVALRSFILPGICVCIIAALRSAGLVPNERPFLLAMLVATSSPSAINSSVICAMHDYHAHEYTRMTFFMYTSCIVSSALWLFVDIVYLGATWPQTQ